MARINFGTFFPGIMFFAALLLTWLCEDGIFGQHELRCKGLVFLIITCIITPLIPPYNH